MASFSPSEVPFGMPLRSVMVQASLPRATLAVISPSSVKLAYEERISRPLSVNLETIVSFAMDMPSRVLNWRQHCSGAIVASMLVREVNHQAAEGADSFCLWRSWRPGGSNRPDRRGALSTQQQREPGHHH